MNDRRQLTRHRFLKGNHKEYSIQMIVIQESQIKLKIKTFLSKRPLF